MVEPVDIHHVEIKKKKNGGWGEGEAIVNDLVDVGNLQKLIRGHRLLSVSLLADLEINHHITAYQQTNYNDGHVLKAIRALEGGRGWAGKGN